MINIRDRRLRLGMTMKDVADKVGVSESAVSRWETGDVDNMKRDKILLLANALQISPIDLLDCNSLVAIPVNSKNGNLDEVIVRYSNLSDEHKDMVLGLLRALGGASA